MGRSAARVTRMADDAQAHVAKELIGELDAMFACQNRKGFKIQANGITTRQIPPLTLLGPSGTSDPLFFSTS